MPTVPFTPKSPSAPKIDETFVAMAAADLHAADMLFEPKRNVPEAQPLASFGGRSIVESNNPELGPTEAELRAREQDKEKQRRRNAR